ncbi:hypothetical protein DHEL01_v207090, partial [Diaporthe helianthi]
GVAGGSILTASSGATAPPRPPRPTSNQSFWTDNSSILKSVGDIGANPGLSNSNSNSSSSRGGLVHEASSEGLIQQSPVYSPKSHHGPLYSPPGDNNNNMNNKNNMPSGLGVPDAGRDTLKPSTNGKRLTPLEEESSLRGSCLSNNTNHNNTYNSNLDSYYNAGGNGQTNANTHHRSSSKYSTGAFIEIYGSPARNVVEGMELIVPMNQQQRQQQGHQRQGQRGQGQGQGQGQWQGQGQYSPQYPQYPQYPQQYGYSQNQHRNRNQNPSHARQVSPQQHRRKPSVAEAPMYMAPGAATGGYGRGGML